MATVTCPNCGAASATTDYCDSCGSPLAAAAAPDVPVAPPTTPPPPPAMAPCPNCGAARSADDAFCEGCGLDFATGQMPVVDTPSTAGSAPSGPPSGWTAVVEADRAFFASNTADGGSASLSFPDGLAPRRIPLNGDEVVIGRRSEAKGFFPGIDLSSPVADPGVSHRHAALRRQADGSWAVIDEMSTNGTWINGSHEPLDHGVLVALHDGDHLNVGVFTRITIVHESA